MKFAHEAFFLAILASAANSQPSNDANDISRPPSPLPLSESPATTPSPSPSTNPNSASEWLQTISMTQNQPPKISRPSRPPPKSSATQTVSEEACTPSESASGSPTTSEAPSQTEEIRLPMGYIDATSLQWVFTWRKCGGGYESVQSSTSTKQEVVSTKTESVQSSSSSLVVDVGEGSLSTASLSSSAMTPLGPGWTTTATTTETKWVTVTETTTAVVSRVDMPTMKLP